MFQKIISVFLILFIWITFFVQNTFAKENKKIYFRVTAYYSPLPNQSHYIKWTYEAEVKMNGKWSRWSSWKKVFSGMLAAPKKYVFGTKIYLKWLWVGEVSDRWWAIVETWKRNFKYDRIDIWCGYWEKGLQRAMFWGNRVIEGKIVSRKSKITLNINKIPSPRWTLNYAIKNKDLLKTKYITHKIYLSWKTVNKKYNKNTIFSWPIKDSTWVKKLQKILKELNLYSWKINGQYSSIRNIILDFQLKNKIISKKTDLWAGNFWPKTRKVLKEKYNLFLKNKEKERQKQVLIQKQKEIALQKARKKVYSLWFIKYWDVSPQVRELQIILKKLWFFKYKDTAIFWPKTRKSLIKYQISRKIIKNSYSKWAWIFWPKTRKYLILDLVKKEYKKN